MAAEQVDAIILAIGLKLLTFNKLIYSLEDHCDDKRMDKDVPLFPFIHHSTGLNSRTSIYLYSNGWYVFSSFRMSEYLYTRH